MVHRHLIHSEPKNGRDYTTGQGHCELVCAYTSRTMPRADLHRDDDHQHRGDGATGPLRSVQSTAVAAMKIRIIVFLTEGEDRAARSRSR